MNINGSHSLSEPFWQISCRAECFHERNAWLDIETIGCSSCARMFHVGCLGGQSRRRRTDARNQQKEEMQHQQAIGLRNEPDQSEEAAEPIDANGLREAENTCSSSYTCTLCARYSAKRTKRAIPDHSPVIHSAQHHVLVDFRGMAYTVPRTLAVEFVQKAFSAQRMLESVGYTRLPSFLSLNEVS